MAQPYRDVALPVDARVRDLLGRMTLEEKFWQLYMIPGGRDDPRHERWVIEPGTYRVLVGASSMDIRLRGDLEIAP